MTDEIVIIGGGTGGAVLANDLAERLGSEIDAGEVRVRLLNDGPDHVYKPVWLYVPFGKREPADGRRPLRELIDSRIEIEDTRVTEIDTDGKQLRTTTDSTPPTASVGPDTTVDEDTSVSFDASGSTDNVAIASYEWDWTGDGTYEATGQTASHTFVTPGTYTVTLRVTDSGGNTETAQRTVTVEDVGSGGGGGGGRDTDTTDPTARTQTDVTIDAGTTLAFDGSNSMDNDDVWAYEWDFDGDGTYDDRGVSVSHSYTEPGTYTVTLRVTDHSGNTDTALRTVTVQAVDESEQNNGTDTVNNEKEPDGTGTGGDGGPVNPGDDGTATETPPTTAIPQVTDTETAVTADSTMQETATSGSGPLSPVLVVVAMVLTLLVHRQRGRE